MLIGVTAARQVTRRPCRLRDEKKNQSKQSKQNFKYVCVHGFVCVCLCVYRRACARVVSGIHTQQSSVVVVVVVACLQKTKRKK